MLESPARSLEGLHGHRSNLGRYRLVVAPDVYAACIQCDADEVGGAVMVTFLDRGMPEGRLQRAVRAETDRPDGRHDIALEVARRKIGHCVAAETDTVPACCKHLIVIDRRVVRHVTTTSARRIACQRVFLS